MANRRNILLILSLLAALACPACAEPPAFKATSRPAASQPADPAFRPLTVGPYLLAADCRSMTVCWATGQAARGKVEFGETADYGRSVPATQPQTRQKVTLTGLAAGREYHYRVVTDAGATEDFVFRALPGADQPLTFVVDGDQRGADIAMRHYAAYRRIRPHLVVSLGDIANDNDTDYDSLLGMDRRLWASTPWYPVFGNHDVVGELGGHAPMREVFAIPDPPIRGRQKPAMIFYSFRAGGCHFSVIDEIDWMNQSTEDEQGRQSAWSADDLRAARKDCRFVFTMRHDAMGSLWEAGEAKQPPMDIYFYGGIHNYFRGQLDNGLAVIQASGGGVTALRDPPEGEWVKAARKCFNYVRVDVDGDKLKLRAYDLGLPDAEPTNVDGELMDTLEMKARKKNVE